VAATAGKVFAEMAPPAAAAGMTFATVSSSKHAVLLLWIYLEIESPCLIVNRYILRYKLLKEISVLDSGRRRAIRAAPTLEAVAHLADVR
jgi:hypothetical protein